MKFINNIQYVQDAEKIAALRPQHRDYLAGLLAQGKLVAAGPYTDDSGALMIYEADTPEQAEAFAANDPFALGGVFAKYEIKPWKVVFGNAQLLQPAL
jgi:uncharacterized protein YciI